MSFPPVLILFSHLLLQVGKENDKRDKERKGEEWKKTEGTLIICDLCWTNSPSSLMFLSSITSPYTSRILPPTSICIELALTPPLSLHPFSVFLLIVYSPGLFSFCLTSLFSLLLLCLYILFSPIIFPFSLLFLQSKTDQDSRLKCFPLFCAVQCRSNRRHSHVGNLMLGKLLFFSPTRCYSCKWAVLNFACVVECNNSYVGKVHWWYFFFF